MQTLRLQSVGSKIHQILHVIFQRQVSFSSNFASIFSVMKLNFSVPFLPQTKFNFHKSSTSKCKFWDLPLLPLKFTKFLMSFLEPRVNVSSKFALLFSVMKHNSSVLFHLKRHVLWRKCRFLAFRLLTWKLAKFHIIFHNTCHFSFKFCIILQCHDTWFPWNFLAETLYVLHKKSPSM